MSWYERIASRTSSLLPQTRNSTRVVVEHWGSISRKGDEVVPLATSSRLNEKNGAKGPAQPGSNFRSEVLIMQYVMHPNILGSVIHVMLCCFCWSFQCIEIHRSYLWQRDKKQRNKIFSFFSWWKAELSMRLMRSIIEKAGSSMLTSWNTTFEKRTFSDSTGFGGWLGTCSNIEWLQNYRPNQFFWNESTGVGIPSLCHRTGSYLTCWYCFKSSRTVGIPSLCGLGHRFANQPCRERYVAEQVRAIKHWIKR